MAHGLPSSFTMGSDSGLPRPDLVLYMQVPVDVLSQRAGFGDEVYDKVSVQQRVHACYQELRDERWRDVEADREEEKVAQQIREFVDRVSIREQIDSLW